MPEGQRSDHNLEPAEAQARHRPPLSRRRLPAPERSQAIIIHVSACDWKTRLRMLHIESYICWWRINDHMVEDLGAERACQRNIHNYTREDLTDLIKVDEF